MPESKLAEIIGQNITTQRTKLGLSQKELAGLLEITRESMSRIEKGAIAPKISRLEEIATFLQCSASSLLLAPNTDIQERSLAIAETLESLSPEQQEAVLNVMYSTVSALKKS